MNWLGQMFSPGVFTPIRNSIFRELQLMIADTFSKILKYILLAFFVGFIVCIALVASAYFYMHRQQSNENYAPVGRLKVQNNSMISSLNPATEIYLMNADYNRIERTSNRNENLRLNNYEVQDGESLSEICKRFNVSVEVVRQANQLEPWNTIAPGTQLYIPLN